LQESIELKEGKADNKTRFIVTKPTVASHGLERSNMNFVTGELKIRVEQLRKEFDFIVIDGPPLYFADALVLVESADAVVVCCPEGKFTTEQMRRAVALVLEHKTPSCQVLSVLTNCRLTYNLETNQKSYAYYRRGRTKLSVAS
jgi:cellulose biosynthesis protein BcsQ